MTKSPWGRGITRRRMLQSSVAATATIAAAAVFQPKLALAADKVVKIGFLAPLTGAVAAWGKPGLDGCSIWADWVNDAGGVKIGADTYKIEFVAYDEEYDAGKARAGATKLIKEDGVKFIMMLGGDPWPGVQEIAAREGMLVSTLLPSDLTPETTTLIAPCEVHPVYNVTGVQWLAENLPDLKTAVICAQDDALGLPSVATYLAAFEAAGIEMLDDPLLFDPATTDFAPVVTKMLSLNPDIISLDTCYADYVHPICQQLHLQGFKGQIISCTADFYPKMIEKTSEEFMEGFIFQFPDFDDEALNDPRVNFKRPNEFYAEYAKRYGESEWGAVSWEYASIMDLWLEAAQKAGTVEPGEVLTAMKAGGKGKHAFGDAEWWGKELFGIDNALVGYWPVVVVENGKAVIKEFKSIPEWMGQHQKLLVKHMDALGQMYYQR
ncbi:MAG: ABC transporter substrate-binding protein [Kiloniellales bacterium]